MSKSILNEALEDAKLLKETAIQNARNVLVEAISPQIKEFIDSQMEDGMDSMENPMDSAGQISGDMSGLEPEMIEKLIGLLQGMKSGDGAGMKMGGKPPGDEFGGGEPEGDSPFGDPDEEEMPLEGGMYENSDKDEDDEGEEDEEIEENTMKMKKEEYVKIDERDLEKAWAEVVKEEALEESQTPSPQVSAAFADAQNPNSLAKGGLGDKGAPGERGLEDKEKEKMWKDATAPAAQDFTVAERKYRSYIHAIQTENKKLKNENQQLSLGIGKLQRSLTEVNLFNSKLLMSNKLLQGSSLTNEQRISVIEAFDRAENLHEVELVYKSLSESLKIAGVLGESKQAAAGKRQRGSRFTTSATANMLREHAEGSSSEDKEETLTERWQTLAGVLGE
jgi:hypothetical protein